MRRCIGRPYGTWCRITVHPAMNRRAIFGRPSGAGSAVIHGSGNTLCLRCRVVQKHAIDQEYNVGPPARAQMSRGARVVLRLICIAAVAGCIGWGLNRSATSLNRESGPAGFGRGMLQGALMPLALPNLLVGHDVAIYAADNTGRTYKLGYTLGVNLCGLLFFGFFFWRVRQWRKRDKRSEERPS